MSSDEPSNKGLGKYGCLLIYLAGAILLAFILFRFRGLLPPFPWPERPN
jgi:hypothetical protein